MKKSEPKQSTIPRPVSQGYKISSEANTPMPGIIPATVPAKTPSSMYSIIFQLVL